MQYSRAANAHVQRRGVRRAPCERKVRDARPDRWNGLLGIGLSLTHGSWPLKHPPASLNLGEPATGKCQIDTVDPLCWHFDMPLVHKKQRLRYLRKA